MKDLEDFLRLTQRQLFKRLCKKFKGKLIISKDNFILVRGSAPVMLVAHLDTVHEQPVRDICTSTDGNILMSPQGIGGDDRCGVFALVKIYQSSKVKPWLLFTCDEEIGVIGAKLTAKALAMLCSTTAQGSFSDISLIAPELGIAAVNLSSGYYNAHTRHEYINRAEFPLTFVTSMNSYLTSTLSTSWNLSVSNTAIKFSGKFTTTKLLFSIIANC